MKTIRLYGDLAKDFKHEWVLDVSTPSEALRAINSNRPGFCAAADAGHYVVLMVNEKTSEMPRQVSMESGLDQWGDEVIMVFPKIQGEFTAAIISAIAGAASATSAAVGVVGATAAISGIAATAIATVLNIAIAIAVSAIATLITGGPEAAGPQEENKPSYLFNGVVNTARQGYRIPVLYGGPLLVGSMVLSSRVNTQDIEL